MDGSRAFYGLHFQEAKFGALLERSRSSMYIDVIEKFAWFVNYGRNNLLYTLQKKKKTLQNNTDIDIPSL
jgi:hypothetical protein